MRILFIADGRSPIALNWMKHWTARGDEVYLVSTFACQPDLPLSSLDFVPVAFSGAKSAPTGESRRKSLLWSAATLRLRMGIRHWLGPLTLPDSARRLNEIIHRVRPDLVHAMRIPYEGMLAAAAKRLQPEGFPPLLLSIWGNDFTLHAPASPLMRRYTRLTLQTADALHADCRRDIRLARRWGFPAERPGIVLPGNGGVDMDVFFPPAKERTAPLVINPRGFRSYVRNDTFFRAVPLILAQRPDVRFVCPAMAGEPQAEKWLADLGIQKAVDLLPPQTRPQMAALYRQAQIWVSPSTHDGTPNSLLEGLACGCFPVAGDLESIREWITSGVNGLLIDPARPQTLAEAVLRALNDDDLRLQAAKHNAALIAERAEYQRGMARAEKFYSRITAKT
ncbi:MAG: glycosyltransferase family 4 protein [Chloroflexi bacterium]|nr:glycosyltransferase family 4 protein [Chloroflexota bacterium]